MIDIQSRISPINGYKSIYIENNSLKEASGYYALSVQLKR